MNIARIWEWLVKPPVCEHVDPKLRSFIDDCDQCTVDRQWQTLPVPDTPDPAKGS